jgi:preprotein translocase subunit SecD
MRRSLLAAPIIILALAIVVTPARAEDSQSASPCALTAFPAPQVAAPPGYVESARRRVVGWFHREEPPDAVLARQGGLRLVLRADGESFRATLLDDLRDDVRCLMREARIAHGELTVRDGGVELQLREPSDAVRAGAALAAVVRAGAPSGAADVRDTGNGLIRLAPTPPAYEALRDQALDRAVTIIQRRLSELGIVSAHVRRDGADRIVVIVPGTKDAAHFALIATARGRLEFRVVDTSLPPDVALIIGVPPGSELVRRPCGRLAEQRARGDVQVHGAWGARVRPAHAT